MSFAGVIPAGRIVLAVKRGLSFLIPSRFQEYEMAIHEPTRHRHVVDQGVAFEAKLIDPVGKSLPAQTDQNER